MSNTNKGIYMILNIINNKSYVGQSVNLRKRKSDHFNQLRKNKHRNRYLQASFNKYGEKYFKWVVLENNIDNLLEQESYWINVRKSLDAGYGYNIELPDARLNTCSVSNIKKTSNRYYVIYANKEIQKIYDSCHDAAKDYNLEISKLNRQVRLPNGTFIIKEKNYKDWKYTAQNNVLTMTIDRYNNTIIHDSRVCAAKYLNTDDSNVHIAIKNFRKCRNHIVINASSYKPDFNYSKYLIPKVKIKTPRILKKLYATNLSNNETVEYESLNKFIELNPEFKYKGIEKVLYGERNHYKGFSFSR